MDVTPPAKRRREPVPASVAGRVATLLLLAVAWAAVDAAADAPELRDLATSFWLALAAGTVVAGVTPVSRLFRRVSAWPVALLVAGAMAYLAYESGTSDRSSYVTVGYVAAFLLGLDLRWVSRLRVWVIVSGICLIPALVLSGRGPVLWAGAWLAGAFVTLWILSADVHRAVERPADANEVRPRVRRPLDLARIGIAGLSLGIVFGLMMDSPGFSFRPLERVVRYLPFRPDLDLADLDIRDYEVDDNGFEVRYRVTPDGQRFVVDPNTNEPFAVVERDGVDEFRSYLDDVVATIPDGASTLLVPHADGTTTTTYRRDDRGWYVEVDGLRYRAELRGGTAMLLAPTGAVVDAGSVGMALPPAAVLEGTAGEDTRLWRYGDIIEVDGWRQGRRSYRLYSDELEVEVRRRGDDYEYRWAADRSEVRIYVEEYRQSGTLVMDRDGNAFDYLRARLAENPAEPAGEPSPWPDRVKRALSVALAASALGGVAVLAWRARRRGGRADRGWAEAQFARIEAFGATRAEPRGKAESVVAYLDRLAREVDDDDGRLRAAGEVLDDALYGAEPLTPNERARVESTIDAVIRGVGPEDRTGPRRPALTSR